MQNYSERTLEILSLFQRLHSHSSLSLNLETLLARISRRGSLIELWLAISVGKSVTKPYSNTITGPLFLPGIVSVIRF